MHGGCKMEIKELEKLEPLFKKYLNYNGINLWDLSNAAIYNNFLKFPKMRNFFKKLGDKFLKKVVRLKQIKRERKQNFNYEKKEIFIIVYGLAPINTFKPLIKELKNTKIISYDPPSNNITAKILSKEQIPYLNIDNYMDEKIIKKLRKAERWLKFQWEKIKKDKKIKKELGKNYYNIMQGLEYFCKTRKSYLEIIRLLELYNKAYKIGKPKIIIISDDVNAYGKAAVLVAKKLGIKSIVIQHGQLQGNPVGKISADKMAVNGYKDKEFLISQGAKKEQIVVTGQPRFDKIANSKFTKENSCKKFGLDPRKKIIIFAAQKPSSEENITKKAINCFLKEIKKIKNKEDFEFIITMRKDMLIKQISKINKKCKIKIIRWGDIHNLLSCCDVLITAFSTVAIEAVLLDKPVIAINIGAKKGEYIEYGDEGVGFKITSEEDFLPSLNKILYDKRFKERFKIARKKFIKNYNYKLDGKSNIRVVKLIKKMIKDDKR